MINPIQIMLKKYETTTIEEKKNALKEIVQEIALLGLFRGNFYTKAAFYGGTALRIFYGLDRFSEDLDFSLYEPDSNFDLNRYLKFIETELGAYGFEMKAEQKKKTNDSEIMSAFIKGNTVTNMLKITPDKFNRLPINRNEQLKIKLEVDINPPKYGEYEVKYLLNPIPFSVKLFSESSLFAGKLHALLCRAWKTRVKGRDLYDYVWYLSKSAPLNLKHLEARMQQSGHLKENINLTKELLSSMLQERFSEIDYSQAKQDVIPFIKDSEKLQLWSEEFFQNITDVYLKI
ncbi:MAG: nucleotidyl transferase AbiEii/AbiGii toxin family protein [Candidatus Cloacimonadales bacterium]